MSKSPKEVDKLLTSPKPIANLNIIGSSYIQIHTEAIFMFGPCLTEGFRNIRLYIPIQ
jgi:hypothetical protein